MDFELTPEERRARAISDLRVGLPVGITGPTPVIACAIETLTETRLKSMRGMGQVFAAITDWRAQTLNTPVYDGDLTRIELPADAGLAWLQAIAGPAQDLAMPMKGPFRAQRGGDVTAVRAGIHLAKEARLLPAVLCVDVAPSLLGGALTLLKPEELVLGQGVLEPVVNAKLPLSVSPEGRLWVFRPAAGGEEHYALEIGSPDRSKPVLTRLHSACFTGDLLGSLKCDCGPQLRAALAAMGAAGAGVLMYLNQEGRGIGLTNKMRAYALQDVGFDTVEANHRLGFEDDERDLTLGAAILRQLGFSQARLMTNNPAKVARLEGCGIEVVERVPLRVGQTPENAAYLATKAAKSGHLM
ncbi:MAG: GTP cyclohydrolase II [Pseudomonadota bacterium]